jgi:hypothetical protein
VSEGLYDCTVVYMCALCDNVCIILEGYMSVCLYVCVYYVIYLYI